MHDDGDIPVNRCPLCDQERQPQQSDPLAARTTVEEAEEYLQALRVIHRRRDKINAAKRDRGE